MSFFSEFYRVDKLFKAITAPFFSPSSSGIDKEEKVTSEEMPGIFGQGDQNDINHDVDVEEAEIWQNDEKNNLDKNFNINSKNVGEENSDIIQTASDVLNGILTKITNANGVNDSESYENEPETSTDFVDALSNVEDDDDFLSNLLQEKLILNADFSLNKEEQKNLLDLTFNNSQLETPVVFENHFSNDLQTTSTPICDDYASKSNDFLTKSNEFSFDSFETAVSTMSDDRPIASKGQYSLDFEQLMASGDAAVEAMDPFGGRASSKNKTFTRKSSKPKDNTSADSVVVPDDPNANDVEKTPKSTLDDIKEAKNSSETIEKPTEDVKNSNVDDSKTPIVQNGAKSKDKVPVDETPKKAKVDAPKREPNVKTNQNRAAGGQQTAIVAPMINTNVVEQQHSSDVNLQAKAVKTTSQPVPIQQSTAQNLLPPTTVPKQDSSHSDEEFVMASSDMFADPNAMDFLQKAGANSVVDSELYRQSLYVKFDPLVTERAAATTNKSAVVAPVKQPNKPSASAVPPSSSKTVLQTPVTPVSSSRDETLSAEETASADKKRKENDDLLMLKAPTPKTSTDGQTSPVCPPTVVLKKKPVPQARPGGDVDNMLTISPKHQQATTDPGQPETSVQQLKMQFQAYVMAKEKEWVTKFREEREKSERLIRENTLLAERASAYEKNTTEMKLVVLEYDKTIRDLTRQLEKHKSNKHDDYDQIFKDKEQALEDLQSVENAFSELHRRYEKLRSSTEDFKKNEEKLRECVVDLQNKLKQSEEKFRKLKDHAEDKLESANAEIEKLQKAKETDTLALRALVKKRDLQVETLEKSLEQKQKEIQELSAICDELIQKVDYPQNTQK